MSYVDAGIYMFAIPHEKVNHAIVFKEHDGVLGYLGFTVDE